MVSLIKICMKLQIRYLCLILICCLFLLWTIVNFIESDVKNDLPQSYFDEKLSNRPYNVINLNELYWIGGCLLAESGKKIVDIRKRADLSFNRKAGDNSIVTEADLESHNIIVGTLRQKFKDLKVISEESDTKDKNFNPRRYLSKCDTYQKKNTDLYFKISDLSVWIDPLDATQEYSENLTNYVTVMFCIAIKGEPKAGIIHKPFSNITVGSFLVNKSRKPKNITSNRIIISRSHAGTVKKLIENTNISEGENPELIIAGGSGYKTITLLHDESDLYLHSTKINKWDICAPNAILNNLGGKLTARNGMKVDYADEKEPRSVNGIIAALDNYKYYFNLFKKA